MASTPKRHKLASEKALNLLFQSRLYPTFRGIEGPSRDMDPGDSSVTDCFLFLGQAIFVN